MDPTIVKALRKKCNDLEDELESEVEAKDEALAAKTELEEELAQLRKEIQEETEAQQLAEVAAGQGKEVLERLQRSLEDARQRTAVLEGERLATSDMRDERAKRLEELKDARAAARERFVEVEEETKQTKAAGQSSEEQLCESQALLSEERVAGDRDEAQHLELRDSAQAAQQRLKAAEGAQAELSSRLEKLEADGRDLDVREAAAEEDRAARKTSLQQALDKRQEEVASLLDARDKLDAEHKISEERLREISAAPAASRSRLAVLEEELEVAAVSSSDMVSRATQAEMELQEAQQASEQAEKMCSAVGVELVSARSRMEEVELLRDQLEVQAEDSVQKLKESEVAAMAEIEARAGPLQNAFNEAYEQRMDLDRKVAELRTTRRCLEDELHTLAESRDALRSKVSLAESDLQAAQGAEAVSQSQTRVVEEALVQEQQSVILATQLQEELRARLDEVARHQELLERCDAQERERVEEEENMQALTQELAAEREGRSSECITDRTQELAARIEDLGRQSEEARHSISALEEEVDAEHRERMADQADHQEFRTKCDLLREEVERATAEAARHAAELEAEGRRRAEQEEAITALEAELEKACLGLEDSSGALQRAEEELAAMVQARDEERRRVEELQGRFAAVQPEHEALFARYSEVIEQIDMSKGEKQKLASEAERLRTSIAKHRGEANEARRQQESAEAAPPSQVAVSDVLISVRMEGASAPLELKPWDTNFESVVSEWLAVEHKNAELQNVLVRYLRHLEDTAETFPVKAEAKLHEVREQFAY